MLRPAARPPRYGAALLGLVLGLATVTIGLIVLPACSPGPQVTASTPAAGASAALPVDTGLTLTFDRPMQAATLKDAVAFSPAPAGGFGVEAAPDQKSFRITPTLPLLPDTRYTVTIGRTALGSDGKPLRRQHTIEFTTAKPRAVVCRRPRFSPDGSLIAWTEGSAAPATAAGWAAYVAPADGSGPARQIAANLTPQSEVLFYPDGTALLAVAGTGAAGDPKRHVRLPLAPGAAAQTLPFSTQLTDPGRLTAAFSPSGALLAVQNDMYLADAHSDYFRELGLAEAGPDAGEDLVKFGNLLLGWGLDDTWLLYLDMPGIGEGHHFSYDVYRYSVATRRSTRLPAAGKITNFGGAARSPDGEWYVFEDWFAEEVVSPAGIDIVRLPRDLWLIDSGATRAVRLTGDAGHNTQPSFTGKGGLLFASDRSGDWEVWAMPDLTSPGMAANLTGRSGYDGQPQRSPARELTALVSDASGAREVWVIGPHGWRLVSGRQ